MRRPWRCNSGRTANIATRICDRHPWKRASAPTSARSARIASRANSAMSARTAAAVLSRGRSGRQGNGGPACRSKNDLRRTSAFTCPLVSTISPRIRHGFGIFRRRSAELSPASLRANGSRKCAPRWLAMTGQKSFGRQDRAFDFAEADAIAIALAPAAHHERIAVFEKRPLDAISQSYRLGAIPADFK